MVVYICASLPHLAFESCDLLKLRKKYKPYVRHLNPLLITNRSLILAIHKDRNFFKKLLENKEIVFKEWVKNKQTAAYNGTHIVYAVVTT